MTNPAGTLPNEKPTQLSHMAKVFLPEAVKKREGRGSETQ